MCTHTTSDCEFLLKSCCVFIAQTHKESGKCVNCVLCTFHCIHLFFHPFLIFKPCNHVMQCNAMIRVHCFGSTILCNEIEFRDSDHFSNHCIRRRWTCYNNLFRFLFCTIAYLMLMRTLISIVYIEWTFIFPLSISFSLTHN